MMTKISKNGRSLLPATRWVFPVLLALWVSSTATASALQAVQEPLPPRQGDTRLHEQLRGLKGRPVLINFWATWCEPCREEMPSLQRLSKRLEAQGLTVLTVAVADRKTRVEEFFWEIGVTFPVLDDQAKGISRTWRARVLPTTLVLDRRHQVRLRGLGAIDWDSPAIYHQVEAVVR